MQVVEVGVVHEAVAPVAAMLGLEGLVLGLSSDALVSLLFRGGAGHRFAAEIEVTVAPAATLTATPVAAAKAVAFSVSE